MMTNHPCTLSKGLVFPSGEAFAFAMQITFWPKGLLSHFLSEQSSVLFTRLCYFASLFFDFN